MTDEHLDKSELKKFKTRDLVDELTRRNVLPKCRCVMWGTFIGAYDSDGYTLRCTGCRRSILRCTC